MDWNDVRHFLALAQSGSVRAAGAALGVSHSTVARRVEGLEERLSTRLFDRGPDGYTLTEAGQQMLPGAERIEAEMSALERGVVGQDARLSGTVAVTCVDTYMSRVLLGPLAAFCQEHDEMELRLTADSRPYDLARREADIALRATGVGMSPHDILIGQKVGPVVLASYVSVAHGDALDPESPGAQPRFLGFDDARFQPQAIRDSSYPDVPIWGAFPSLEVAAQAALQGLGIAMLPTYVGDQEPGLRRLTRPDLRHLGDIWMLHHPDLRANARVRATRQVVRRAFEDAADLFAGDRPASGTGCREIAPGTGGPATVS
jgi:DNA-binding transcriptional LysR family regulator